MDIKDLGVTRKEGILSNGCRLVVFERPGLPVYLRASFLSGSQFDPIGLEGTSHFLEHMLVAGSKNFPTKDKLATFIEQYGGEFGAFTGGEGLSVNVEIGDPHDLPQAVKVMSEILKYPRFDAMVIEAERKSILRELGDIKSNPEKMMWEVWRRLYFQKTTIGRSILGNEESIQAITKDDLVKFYNEKLVSGRAVLVASGGITLSQLQAESELNLLIPAGGKQALNGSLKVSRDQAVSIEHFSGKDQVHLAIGFRTCRCFDSDMPTLDVLKTILGGGRASSLTKILRYEKGMVYTVYAISTGLSETGSWMVRTSTAKNNLQEVLDLITKEFYRVYNGKITQEELQFAKDKMIKSKRMRMQTSGSWVDMHSYRELITPDQKWTLSNYVEEVSNVSLDDLKRIGRKYFVPGQWFLGMCGDVVEDDIKVNY